jgi:sucrose-6-phosphate hydrolase SacC (GH32 family)
VFASITLRFEMMKNHRFAFACVLLMAVGSCFSRAEDFSPDFGKLRNPIWVSADNLRDPSVIKRPDGYHIFYSRLAGAARGKPDSWTVAEVVTKDFVHFENERDVSPKGYASPGDVVFWHGRYILPYQTYPAKPTELCFSESQDLREWSAPKAFLGEALAPPWNTERRVIDPSLVIEGDTLHCYFVGSAKVVDAEGKTLRANLLGHAVTRDPKLERWEVLTRDAPLLGVSASAPDGVENVMVFRTGGHWTMIYSEGLADQHLALATSEDLRGWKAQGAIELPRQKWMARKYGAPFVWREEKEWVMILMGEDAAGRTTFGLLRSPDGGRWTLLGE